MDEPTLVVGAVTRAHGLKGEVAVLVISDNPDRFADGDVVYLADGRALTVVSSHGQGARLLVRFAGVDDRTGAEALRGAELVVPISALPDLPEGTYWPHEVEGCAVFTTSGRELGAIVDVVANPANDLWVTVGAGGEEILIPALRDVIVDVDIPGRRVTVAEVPGITAPDEDE